MSRFLKVFAIALLSIFVLVPAASAQHRVFLSGGFVGFGPGWGWYGPGWGWYGPGWYGPWGWGYPYTYAPTPSSGQVNLLTSRRTRSSTSMGAMPEPLET